MGEYVFVDGVHWLDDLVEAFARQALPYPRVYKAKWRVNTYMRGRLCDHIVPRV